jgi:hypothetical protein
MGYTRTNANHAVFTRGAGTALAVIALYVDDITMVASNLATIDRDKQALHRAYKMTDLGELSLDDPRDARRPRPLPGQNHTLSGEVSIEVLARFNKLTFAP